MAGLSAGFQAKRMSAPKDDGRIMYPAAMTVERPALSQRKGKGIVEPA
jgi:hypothetical protein